MRPAVHPPQLDDILTPEDQREIVFRVEFKDPDGSVHPIPYWAREPDEDEEYEN